MVSGEILAQKVKEKDQIAAKNNIKGQMVRLYVSKDKTEAQVWLCDSIGNHITNPKFFYKETGEINGMKIIEYGGLKYIFEVVDKNDYSGIQGFPELFRYNPHLSLAGTLKLPDVIIINKGYFNQSGIERLILSPNIKRVGEMAFYKCNNLKEIIFPEGCSDITIDKDAFAGCSNLEKIVFPESCTNITIDKTAFRECKNLAKVIVPKGKIAEFANMMQLTESVFDDGSFILEYSIEVEKPGTILGKLPLDKLNGICSLKIVGILDENDIEVLKDCIHLKQLDLSNAYTTISDALQKKRNANSAFLRGMIQTIGKLSQEKYDNGEMSTIDNLQVQLFAEIVKGSSNVNEASVGCVIPTGSFSGMKSLETVILPVRASIIESKAFQDCSNLKEVIFPPYLKEIGTGAFAFCRNLKDIVLPVTLTSIGNYDQQHTYGKSAAASFVETGIETIDLGNCFFESNAIDHSWCYRFHCKALKIVKLPNISYIDVGFGSESPVVCYVPTSVQKIKIGGIKEIHFSSIEPPIVEDGLRNCLIYVPKGSLTQYYARFKGDGNIIKEE